ncbi:hypothetical protein [Burkholderia pseudomallei]|uniref:hypothetical protein n=1 Tax=Burkholderia pseudomallei TaxID=28450 RepID=UPI001F211A20|nr:hypothetical protein [Burkholderia pseudomallei]
MKEPGGRFYFSVDLFANFESPNQPGPRNPPTLSAMRFVTHAVPAGEREAARRGREALARRETDASVESPAGRARNRIKDAKNMQINTSVNE